VTEEMRQRLSDKDDEQERSRTEGRDTDTRDRVDQGAIPETQDTRIEREGQRETGVGAGAGGRRESAVGAGVSSSTDTSQQATSTSERRESESATGQGVSLLPQGEVETYRDKWTDVQTNFVDEPKKSVEEADNLVAEVIQKITNTFADERQRLEQRWSSGGKASTEDLRQALQLYRSFFNRLLST
jgi:hypothetical protein